MEREAVLYTSLEIEGGLRSMLTVVVEKAVDMCAN